MTSAVWHFDDYDLASFVRLAAEFGQEHYAYVVTPNTDHLVRLSEDNLFRGVYDEASYILLDSRFLSYVVRGVKGIHLPVCPGSDLSAQLFAQVIRPEDPIVLIGCQPEQARQLAERYQLRNLAHLNPPMGFITDERAVEECLAFIEAHSPFRFCLLAIGSPQQEIIANRLRQRKVARGMGLCIGASINFLTGAEKRAPIWMQKMGMEWLFRLTQSPRRLAKRYLVRSPRVFGMLKSVKIELRPATWPPANGGR